MRTYDAVIVGAGIGGGALALVLARAGRQVLLLEKEREYRDRVRGEWIAPWGVAEVRRLGLYELLRSSGAHHLRRHRAFRSADEPATPLTELALGGLLPDVPGPLSIGHPALCRVLSSEAERLGATVRRGVEKLEFGGAPPLRELRYEEGDRSHTVRCRLLVGADGRGSSVRRALGLSLERDPTHHLFSGMLVDGADGWPEDLQATTVTDDAHLLVFPQGRGRVRLYLGYALEQKTRLLGPEAPQRFLDTFRRSLLEQGARLADARPAGPVQSYGNEDTWLDRPLAPGAVLIGDAAGHNDPIIGQGLSITLRDVRIVSEILLAGDDWSERALESYAEERRERLRRLRFVASVDALIESEFGPRAEARRRRFAEVALQEPLLGASLLATMLGPEKLPDAAFAPAILERLSALE